MILDQVRTRGFFLGVAFLAVFVAGYVVNETADATAAPSLAFSADGAIRSTDGGFQFPDGTIQTTASANGVSTQEVLAAVRRQRLEALEHANDWYLAVAVMGDDGSCGKGSFRAVARNDNIRSSLPYRCAL